MILTIDFETHLIDAWSPYPRPVVLGVKVDDGPVELISPWSNEIVELLDRCDLLVGANIPFDTGVLLSHRPDVAERIWQLYDELKVLDVQTAARLRDIQSSGWCTQYSLQALVARFLGVQLEKDEWRLRYAELESIPFEQWPQGAIDYAKADVETTARLLLDGHVPDLHQVRVQTRTRMWLSLCSAAGLRTDPEGVRWLKKQVALQLAEDEVVLQRYGFLRWNKTRAAWSVKKKEFQQFVVDLCEQCEESVVRTDKGNVKLTEDAIGHLAHEAIPAYLNWTKQTSLSATIEHLSAGMREPIHTHYTNPLTTGRTSSSKPNIQNQRRARGARECFVPSRPGKCFLAIDWSGQELHAWAQVCINMGIESHMAQLLNERADVHTYLGAKIYNTDEATLRARSDFKEVRTLGKVGNFGFQGSMVPYMLRFWARAAYGLDLSEVQANELHEIWGTQAFPEAAEYFARMGRLFGFTGLEARDLVLDDALCKEVYGRRRSDQSLFTQNLRALKKFIRKNNVRATVIQDVTKRIRAKCTFTQACNTKFQGLAADANTHVGWLLTNEVQNDKYSPLYQQPIVAFVHDEFIFECDKSVVDDVRVRAEQIMTDAINPMFFPDVPVRVESTAMDRWSKSAAPKYEAGKIIVDTIAIPWEDGK